MKGIVNYIKNTALGFFGFIKSSNNESFYFDTSSVLFGAQIQKGNRVTFDVRILPNGKTKAIKVSAISFLTLLPEERNRVASLIKSLLAEDKCVDLAVLASQLRDIGIDYMDYNYDPAIFIRTEFSSDFDIKTNYYYEGKVYPAAVTGKGIENLPNDLEADVVSKIQGLIDSKGYFECSRIPQLMNELNKDYRAYSATVIQFVEQYLLKHFKYIKNFSIYEKQIPSVLISIDTNISDTTTEKQSNTVNKNSIVDYSQINELIQKKEYYEAIKALNINETTPNQLGIDGVKLALSSMAGYLGENPNIALNDFQKKLIQTSGSNSLTIYKDDDNFLSQGMRTSIVPNTLSSFKSLCNELYYGKNTDNTSWSGLTERFGQ